MAVPRPDRAAADALFSARVRLWNGRMSPADRLDVVASAPGHARFGHCKNAAPALWVYVYGHYRTFHWTQYGINALAHHSTPGCYMVAAVMPDEVCVRNESDRAADGKPSCAWPTYWVDRKAGWQYFDWRTLGVSSISDVPSLLSKAKAFPFGNKLAYAVIRRQGLCATGVAGMAPMWHLLAAVADWSSQWNGFKTPATAVVVRTRAEAIFNMPFDLRRLQRYFEHESVHLVVAQNSQSDDRGHLFIATSYGCYENDLARPMEHDQFFDRGVSASGGRLRALDSQPVCVCLTRMGLIGAYVHSQCPTTPSCYPRMVDSSFFIKVDNSGMLRHPPQAKYRDPQSFSRPFALFSNPNLEGNKDDADVNHTRPVLYFNASRKVRLADAVYCWCDADTADASTTELSGTTGDPATRFRRCRKPGNLTRHIWADCRSQSDDAAFQQASERVSSYSGPLAVPPPSPPGYIHVDCKGWCDMNTNSWSYKCVNFPSCSACRRCKRMDITP